MTIADDSRDRPKPEGRPDVHGTGSGAEDWDRQGEPFDDPLIEPPERPTGREGAGREGVERERWLRGYIDREQRFRLYFARYIAGLLDHPSRVMRLWRWLIDDFRSERRATAMYLSGAEEGGLIPWLRRRRARRRAAAPD